MPSSTRDQRMKKREEAKSVTKQGIPSHGTKKRTALDVNLDQPTAPANKEHQPKPPAKKKRYDVDVWKGVKSKEQLGKISEFCRVPSRVGNRAAQSLSKKEGEEENVSQDTTNIVTGKMVQQWLSPPEVMTFTGLLDVLKIGHSSKDRKPLLNITKLFGEKKDSKMSHLSCFHPEDLKHLSEALRGQSSHVQTSAFKEALELQVPGRDEQERGVNIKYFCEIGDKAVQLLEENTHFDTLSHGGISLIKAGWDVLKRSFPNTE